MWIKSLYYSVELNVVHMLIPSKYLIVLNNSRVNGYCFRVMPHMCRILCRLSTINKCSLIEQ